MATGPAGAFAVAKQLFTDAAGMDRLDVHLDRELEALVRSADGPEFAEDMVAAMTGAIDGSGGRLYESAGFRRCGPFGDYREDPFSMCMTREI